jgi:hypothetical protein
MKTKVSNSFYQYEWKNDHDHSQKWWWDRFYIIPMFWKRNVYFSSCISYECFTFMIATGCP